MTKLYFKALYINPFATRVSVFIGSSHRVECPSAIDTSKCILNAFYKIGSSYSTTMQIFYINSLLDYADTDVSMAQPYIH